MAVTIKDLLNLEIMRDFKVIAGEKGLSRPISSTEILDFEFIQEGEEYRERGFVGNSLVLSSLLFAKDKPELILQSIKKLIEQNVQAFAYKPVFFKKLPEEALAYAEKRNFPILEFGRDEFFEDIIFSIKSLTEKDDAVLQAEPIFKEMIRRAFTPEEASAACEKMNSFLRPVMTAVCISLRGADDKKITAYIYRGCPDGKLSCKTFVGKFDNKIFIILSQDEDNASKFRAQLDDVLIAYHLMGKDMVIGVSSAVSSPKEFDKIVRQAYWTEKVAEIEDETVKYYKSLGIYKLLVSGMHTRGAASYMEEYLGPLFAEEEKDGELLHTAVEYIKTKGDTIKTAERLYCHKNTIRYRIGKLQEKLDPDSNEKEFYLNLASAVKIYLLLNENARRN